MKSTIHIQCNIFNNFLITILIIAPLTEINLFLGAINAIIWREKSSVFFNPFKCTVDLLNNILYNII